MQWTSKQPPATGHQLNTKYFSLIIQRKTATLNSSTVKQSCLFTFFVLYSFILSVIHLPVCFHKRTYNLFLRSCYLLSGNMFGVNILSNHACCCSFYRNKRRLLIRIKRKRKKQKQSAAPPQGISSDDVTSCVPLHHK